MKRNSRADDEYLYPNLEELSGDNFGGECINGAHAAVSAGCSCHGSDVIDAHGHMITGL